MKNISYRLSLVLWCIVTLCLLTACGIASASVTPKVAAGSHYSIALKSDGTVWGWGENDRGSLGDGTYIDRDTPVQANNLNNVIDITVGGDRSIALKSDGTVWAWGYNVSTPERYAGLDNITAITGGYWTFWYGLKSDGTVMAWGNNNYGQLGNGTTTDGYNLAQYYIPVQVNDLNNVIAISAGGEHGLALKSDGTVWAWGNGTIGQLGNGTYTSSSIPIKVESLENVIAIGTGINHSLAVKSDGTVWAWGLNQYGRLGDGTTESRTTPVKVAYLTNVIAVDGGWYHSLALKSDGTVWAWGGNEYGQLGDGTNDMAYVPIQVLNLDNVVNISTCNVHNVALKQDGTIWVWGNNEAGQLGNGTTTNSYVPIQVKDINLYASTSTTPTPTPTPSISVTPKIAAGIVHNIALDSDGNIWTWGNNWYGQLGDGTTSNRYTPIRVGSLNDVTAIAGGYMFTLALKSDGTVWAWGFNEYGQLGDGTYGNDKYSVTPSKVQNLSDVIAIACGHYHSIALKSDGTVWVWGWTQYGESKYGGSLDEVSVPNPTQVVELSNVIAIASGGEFTITLKSDGTIWAWGNNDFGQLGDGINTYSNIPIQVNGLNDVKAIDGGGTHAIALKSDGIVWTWGRNYFGQLGNGTTTDSNTPVQVDDLQDIIAIAAGEGHSFALKKDGTMWTWGRNAKGELGIGTVTTNSPYGELNPVQVDISDVVAIDGGDGHTIVLKSDGTVYTWGYNKYGQLGSGTTSDSSTPVQVKDLNLYDSTSTPTPTPTTTLTPTPIPSPTPSSSNIFGFVYDSEEKPIEDVTVTIKGDNYSGSTSTDEYGYYGWENLSSGNYTLTYEKEGYQTKTQDVTLGENEDLDLGILTLESVEKGSIFGYVVDFRGYEIGSATIRMKGLHTGYSKTISSDTDGYFEFIDLEADTYILTAKKSGYKQGKRIVKLSEGETREVKLKMKRKRTTSVQSQF